MVVVVNDLRIASSRADPPYGPLIYPAKAMLCIWAMPSMAWWTPSPLRRQSRRIFQVLMRAKTCSTRAHTCAGPYLLVGLVVPLSSPTVWPGLAAGGEE